jgi:phosphoribosyl 1,2-cyclic phosphodiesterase
MGMRFTILGTSSAGNCALVVTDDCKVLIDAGFSAKRIGEMLEDAGESPETIDAIVLTHEHGDHCAGLSGMCRRAGIKVFANRGTAAAIQPTLKRRPEWQLFETGSRFRFRDLEVETFSIPHDAADPVGLIFSHGEGDLFSPRRRLAWLTDLGYAPELVKERIRDVDVLVLESNHDLPMLQQDTRRPWSVKQRISGRHGHLSNEAARQLLESVSAPRWKQVYLAHLSRDCNSLAAVAQTFDRYLAGQAGFSVLPVAAGDGSPFYDL